MQYNGPLSSPCKEDLIMAPTQLFYQPLVIGPVRTNVS